MITIINKVIPFGGFKAMAMWPFIFCRGEATDKMQRHESIHGRQQIEMLIVGFYIAYLICWVIEMVRCAMKKHRGQVTSTYYRQRNYWHRVEHSIIFEREAYAMEYYPNYLRVRKFWAWTSF